MAISKSRSDSPPALEGLVGAVAPSIASTLGPVDDGISVAKFSQNKVRSCWAKVSSVSKIPRAFVERADVPVVMLYIDLMHCGVMAEPHVEVATAFHGSSVLGSQLFVLLQLAYEDLP